MEAALEGILINTYNPNQGLRKQAEQALQQFLATAGSLSAIINCIGNANMHRELRQATSLVLKNRLRDYCSDGEKALPTSQPEKDYLKQQIVQIILVETDNSIRGILAESIRIMAEFEFPQRWPDLVPTLIANLQNPDVLKIYNSLLALRKLVKRFEYKQKEERQPLNDILQYSFPHLQGLMTFIINNNSIEAASVMRLCLKIFWSSTNYMLPKVSGVDVNLWFQMISEIMNKRLPEASEHAEPLGQPEDPEERKIWPWWKLKKWASRIMTHFIQRYGNPRYCNEEDKNFAEYFRSTTAVVLLGPAMNNLQMKASGAYLTDDVHRSCLTYVSNCAEMSPTYKVMKPHMDFILFHVVFPTLCLTPADAQLFDEDPIEFIRKIHDPVGDWLSPMVAATNLLQMLARYREKDVMPVFLPFLQNILAEYNSSSPETRDYRKKDGALVAMAALSKLMKDNEKYERLLLPILIHHILPEFKSPVAFLRARACWCIEYFSEIDWEAEATLTDITLYLQEVAASDKKKGKKDKKKPGKEKKKGADGKPQMTAGEALQAVLQGLIQNLRDPALPVQTAAACSLRLLIDQDGAADLLRPLLPQIVAEYFRIMEEAENESILSALQAIVLKYGEEIADLAPQMVHHLVNSFNQYAQETDEEEAAFNAVQCLDTIDAVLEAVQERADVLSSIEPMLLPLFLRVLSSEGDCFEYIDTIVHMISGYTYYNDTISPTMWSVCGPLLNCLNEWAIDYVTEIMVPILNYMTRGIELFLQGSHEGKPFVVILLEVIQKTYENEEGYSGRDINSASTLLTCLINSSKPFGNILHSILPQILNMVLTKLQVYKLTSVRVRLLEIVMCALYYDAPFTLSVFQQFTQTANNGVDITTAVFTMIFEKLKDMDRDFTQRMIVLSFTALMSLPANQLPECVQVNLPTMFQQVVRELVLIEEEARKDPEDDEDADDDDDECDEDDEDFDDDDDMDHLGNQVDDDDEADFDDADEKKAAINRAKALYVPDGGYGEDEDCVNAEDEEYREMLEQMDKEERVKRELYLAGDPVDDEEDDDFTYTSPIENLNMSQVFLEALQQIATRDGPLVNRLRGGLDGEDNARFEQIVQFAQNPVVVAENK